MSELILWQAVRIRLYGIGHNHKMETRGSQYFWANVIWADSIKAAAIYCRHFLSCRFVETGQQKNRYLKFSGVTQPCFQSLVNRNTTCCFCVLTPVFPKLFMLCSPLNTHTYTNMLKQKAGVALGGGYLGSCPESEFYLKVLCFLVNKKENITRIQLFSIEAGGQILQHVSCSGPSFVLLYGVELKAV